VADKAGMARDKATREGTAACRACRAGALAADGNLKQISLMQSVFRSDRLFLRVGKACSSAFRHCGRQRNEL